MGHATGRLDLLLIIIYSIIGLRPRSMNEIRILHKNRPATYNASKYVIRRDEIIWNIQIHFMRDY